MRFSKEAALALFPLFPTFIVLLFDELMRFELKGWSSDHARNGTAARRSRRATSCHYRHYCECIFEAARGLLTGRNAR